MKIKIRRRFLGVNYEEKTCKIKNKPVYLIPKEEVLVKIKNINETKPKEKVRHKNKNPRLQKSNSQKFSQDELKQKHRSFKRKKILDTSIKHERFIPIFFYNKYVIKSILLDKRDEFKAKGYGRIVKNKKNYNQKTARQISFNKALKYIENYPLLKFNLKLSLTPEELIRFKTIRKIIREYYIGWG